MDFLQDMVNRNFSSDGYSILDSDESVIEWSQIKSEYEHCLRYLVSNRSHHTVIAINMKKNYRYLLLIAASIAAGVTFVPCCPDWPATMMEEFSETTRASLEIDIEKYEEILKQGKKSQPYPQVSLQDTVMVIATSGSTGTPKGVRISRYSLEVFLRWHLANMPWCDRIHFLHTSPLHADTGIYGVLLWMLYDLKLFVSTFTSNFFQLAEEIHMHRISLLVTTANNVGVLFDQKIRNRVDLSSLKYFMLGGSRFTRSAYEGVFSYFSSDEVEVYNCYGPAEVTLATHFARLVGDPSFDIWEEKVSIGHPMETVACFILDSQLQPIDEAWSLGQIALGGSQVMQGYAGDHVRTIECVKTLPQLGRVYLTGDLGCKGSDGRYYVVGRMDETIKCRGFRVNLLDIDFLLSRIPGVREAVTIARYVDRIEDHRLVAYIELEAENNVHEVAIVARDYLAPYQIPDHFEVVSEFPRNQAGKIDRFALQERSSIAT